MLSLTLDKTMYQFLKGVRYIRYRNNLIIQLFRITLNVLIMSKKFNEQFCVMNIYMSTTALFLLVCSSAVFSHATL